MSSNPTSEVKLAVAVAEIIAAIHFNEHKRIATVYASYKLLNGEKVPDILITMQKPSEETA